MSLFDLLDPEKKRSKINTKDSFAEIKEEKGLTDVATTSFQEERFTGGSNAKLLRTDEAIKDLANTDFKYDAEKEKLLDDQERDLRTQFRTLTLSSNYGFDGQVKAKQVLKKLNELNPEKYNYDLEEKQKEVGLKYQQKAIDAREDNKGILGEYVVPFAAGMGAGIVDPSELMANIALPGAGPGASLMKKFFMGAAENLAIEGAKIPQIQEYYESVGQEYGISEKAWHLGMAGAFGGLFPVAQGAIGGAVTKGRFKVKQSKAQKRINEILEEDGAKISDALKELSDNENLPKDLRDSFLLAHEHYRDIESKPDFIPTKNHVLAMAEIKKSLNEDRFPDIEMVELLAGKREFNPEKIKTERIRSKVERNLLEAGVEAEEASMNAKLMSTAFENFSKKSGVDIDELYNQYGPNVRQGDNLTKGEITFNQDVFSKLSKMGYLDELNYDDLGDAIDHFNMIAQRYMERFGEPEEVGFEIRSLDTLRGPNLEIKEKGWLLNIPKERWAEEIEKVYKRDVSTTLKLKESGQLSPIIEINGDVADGFGRMIIAHGLNEDIPVFKFEATKLKQSSVNQTKTEAFKKWFGDSKVVDENGEPLVVYHGTKADIQEFKKEALGSVTGAASASKGYFFSSSYKVAEGYSIISQSDAALKANVLEKSATEKVKNLTTKLSEKYEFEDYDKIESTYLSKIDEAKLDSKDLKEYQEIQATQFVLDVLRDDGSLKDSLDIIKNNTERNQERIRIESERIKRALNEIKYREENNNKKRDPEFEFDENIESIKEFISYTENFVEKYKDEIRINDSFLKVLKKEIKKPQYKNLKTIKDSKGSKTKESNVVETYLSIKNPLVYDFEGSTYREETYNDIIKRAQENGHDGVILKNTFDSAVNGAFGDMAQYEEMSDIFVAFDSTQIKSVKNQGAFNPNDPNIFNQKERGSITFDNGRSNFNINLFKDADRSTFLHESGHLYLEMFRGLADKSPEVKKDLDDLMKWMGVDSADKIGVKEHELFARGFERYMREGKAPNENLKGIFDKFSEWLKDIYKSVRDLNAEINDDVRGIFDSLFESEEKVRQRVKEDIEIIHPKINNEPVNNILNKAEVNAKSYNSNEFYSQAKENLKALEESDPNTVIKMGEEKMTIKEFNKRLEDNEKLQKALKSCEVF